MDLVTGAMGSLLSKLGELLKEEYKLQMSVRGDIKSLEKEMKSMYAALRKVAEVPRGQLDEQVKLWAEEVRELSFEMEDVVDKFLVRVDDGSQPAANSSMLKWLAEKMAGLFTQGKARREIAEAIKAINQQVQEVANRRQRYTVDNIVARPPAVTPIDPRLGALHKEVTELVGITGKRDQLIMKLLSEGDDMSKKKLKIVSVVGFGGLGKTTLVKTVYDKIKEDFNCKAFVSVGRNATAKKFLMDILLALKMYESHFTIFGEQQLIDELQERLKNKRYLIVIDDIWDEELCKVINWAFPKGDNFGSRLITTTRKVSVSKLCCSSANDEIQMEPLSDDDSKMLFHKRIFSQEGGCPRKFEEVSGDILRKCGGVPLAIITIASVLASDQKVNSLHEWKVLLESIGRGLTKDSSVEEMLTILSYSYHDLPSYLKTCFLYLSMFPEDHKIMKDQLIWMWIAERFIQCEDAQTSLYEIGESYFNELVNRSLIQPVYDDADDCFVNACRVHDIVLDLICSLSAEENFVTIVNGSCNTMSSQGIVRRLSLQNARKEDQTRFLRHASIGQVRSVVSFASHAIDLMPPLSTFAVLRVLDLAGYDGFEEDHLNLRELGSLLHLRYLRLSGRGNHELPEEIGKLQFLQVLDLPKGTRLPASVIKLTRLMCLRINSGGKLKLPKGIGNLTSMEVLGLISVDSISIVKELGNMEKLRELNIYFNKRLGLVEASVEASVESLGRMRKIQYVNICAHYEHDVSMDLLGERWVPPAVLRELIIMYGGVKLSRLPAWNSSHLSQLSRLLLRVGEVRQEDLGFLGRLPALRVLWLDSDNRRPLLVGAEGFRCLETVTLLSDSVGSKLPSQILFQPGALPKAQRVDLDIGLRVANWFDLGMENLPSLRHVKVGLHRPGVTVGEAKQAKAGLENALRAHPSRPTFDISIWPRIPRDAHDDDVYNSGDLQELCVLQGVPHPAGADDDVYSSDDDDMQDDDDDMQE